MHEKYIQMTLICCFTILCEKSKIKVLSGFGSSKGCEQNLPHASLSSWFAAIFGIPLLVDASLQFLPSTSHGILTVCVCSVPPLLKVVLDHGPT